jgi:hypothetical protein
MALQPEARRLVAFPALKHVYLGRFQSRVISVEHWVGIPS